MTRQVLIVDDEENIRNALRRALRREGYEIHCAAEAAEALEILGKTPIDLVLSDHLMPNMTGLELLEKVFTRHPETIRILLTGHADMRTAMDAINRGEIFRFLTKPWDDVELKVTLHIAFEQLDLQRTNRRLLALVHRHLGAVEEMERAYPGSSQVLRNEAGVIDLDATPEGMEAA